jgi:general stress protein YciG
MLIMLVYQAVNKFVFGEQVRQGLH